MKSNKFLIISLIFLALLVLPVSAAETYTASTDTTCDGNICNKVLYSGIRNVQEDGEWKRVEDARSLMNKGFEIIILEDDKDFPIEVVDFNFTSITVKLNPKGIKVFEENIPVRVWKQDEEKTEQFYQDVQDGKRISKGLTIDYKETYSKINEEEISYWLLNQEEIKTYNFGMDSILEFGYNSTTIMLQDADTENLDDTYIYEFTPDTNYGTEDNLQTGIGSNIAIKFVESYIKFNISSIPDIGNIISANLNLYCYNNDFESAETGTISIFSLDNRTWDEEIITWNNPPIGGVSLLDLNNTVSGSFGDNFWFNFDNLTTYINSTYLIYEKVSFLINTTGGDAPNDGFDFRSKEEIDTTKRPYLNITYLIPFDINITSPLNQTYTTIPAYLNWTIGGVIEESCWYSDDIGVTNTSVNCDAFNESITPGQGSNQYFMWTNDSSNNIETDNVTFWVDSINPNINITHPTESFYWFGRDSNDSLTIELNWTISDTNLDTCWYFNGTGNTTVTCGDNATISLPYGIYDFEFYVNDSLNNFNSTTFNVEYGALVNNSETLDASVYETEYRSFLLNFTYPSSQFAAAANLFYNESTSYAGSLTGAGDNLLANATFDIPDSVTTTTNRNFYWNVSLTNATDTYYYKITDQLQETKNISFSLCDEINDVVYLNYTFRDEDTDDNLTATVTSSVFDYWLGSGDVKKEYLYSNSTLNPSYAFCFLPNETTLHNEINFIYAKSAGSYGQRVHESTTDLTNITTETVLYLLGTGGTTQSSLLVVNVYNVPIETVLVVIERKIDAVWVQVGQGYTDSAGIITFGVNTDFNYRYTLTHIDYNTEIITLRPTQALYTIILSKPDVITKYTFEGISYNTYPPPGLLNSNTNYTFQFNITDSTGKLTDCKLELRNKTFGIVYDTTGCGAYGGNLSFSFNTSSYEKLFGNYYVNYGSGFIILKSNDAWTMEDIDFTATGGAGASIMQAIQDFIGYEEFGETENRREFTRIVLFFFFLTIGLGIFTRYTGFDLSNPGGSLLLMWAIITIFSYAGFFEIEGIIRNAWLSKYVLWLCVSFLTWGFLINHWRRNTT